MLYIYDKNKQVTGQLQTFGINAEVADVQRKRRLNSDYQLSFLLPMTSCKYELIKEEGLIECDSQFYVIKSKERRREGMGLTVLATCQHISQRLIDIRIPYAYAIEESLGCNISTLTNIISMATGGRFTFQILDTIELKDVYKWGYSNCLKALQDLVNLYEVEFVPDNYIIRIYKKINIENGREYRFSRNIISDTFETNTNTLSTRMTGLAKDSLTIIDLPASHLSAGEYERLNAISGAIVGGIIKVPYLISQYAGSWATSDNAFFDAEIVDTNIEADTEAGKLQLLDVIRKKLTEQEVPDIQIKLNPADLHKKAGSSEFPPVIGETVSLIDEAMEMNDISARIVELTEYPYDLSKNSEVTIANYMLRDYSDIVADLNTSKKVFQSAMTNGKIVNTALEDYVKNAIIDVNNSMTEVIYDTRGIVLREKTDHNRQVVLGSNGLYLTTDGGETAQVAVTAAGIVANAIRVGELNANLVTIRSSLSGAAYLTMDGAGLRANDGTKNTFEIGVDGKAYFRGDITSDARITGSSIVGASIYGSFIATGTTGRRMEFSSSENMLRAITGTGAEIRIFPSLTGAPNIDFYNGTDAGFISIEPGVFFLNTVAGKTDITLSSGKDIKLYTTLSSYKVRVQNWDKFFSDDANQTLQAALNDKVGYASLSGLSTTVSGHTNDITALYNLTIALANRMTAAGF